ncbi:MAG: ribonuclease HI [Candidatus Pacebacteria bacterium]|jgi:ribonuclease HI|nr:ribonuclease HI [Candidatus Paceibacterota bacterium]
MNESDDRNVIIWTDGSSLGNPGPGGFGAVIVWREKNIVREIGGYARETTNNRMELTAVIEALIALEGVIGRVTIHTDSAYVLNGITLWVHGWQKNNWMTAQKKPVLNQDLWQRLLLLTHERNAKGILEWKKVKGHSGNLGNERADVIATSFADENQVELFHGTVDEYSAHIGGSVFAEHAGMPAKRQGKAYSYLSLVDGVLAKHATWAECEARVKSLSGVKFKKALSEADEEAIIREWGL